MAVKTLIETVTVGAGGAASIEFTSIPENGDDLVLVVSGRNSAGSYGATMTFNNDSTNQSVIYLSGSGSSASSGSSTNFFGPHIDASTFTANTFGNCQIYVSNYSSSQPKSVSFDNVTENNGTSAYMNIAAGLWDDTSAITSIEIVPLGGGNFVAYSTASLYKLNYS